MAPSKTAYSGLTSPTIARATVAPDAATALKYDLIAACQKLNTLCASYIYRLTCLLGACIITRFCYVWSFCRLLYINKIKTERSKK